MASVAGLAPARVGLKIRLRELLCIHGQKMVAAEDEKRTRVAARRQTLTLWTQFLLGNGPNRTCYHALAVSFARLVSEEWSQRRDDVHESGSYEVTDHCLDVFVGGGRFLVEQVAIFADHAATQRCLHQLVHAEAFAHPLTSIA